MKELKIVQTTAHFQLREFGGFEHYLCKGLSDLGHKVYLVTSDRIARRYSRERRSLGVGEQTVGQYKVFRFPTLFELIPTEKSAIPFVDAGFMNFVSNLDFDIVHAHEIYQPLSLQSFHVARQRGRPYGFTQHRNFYPKNWQGLFLNLFYRGVGKKIINSCDFVCATTTSAVDFLRDIGVKKRIEILPNCLDTEIFRPNIKTNLKEKMRLQDHRLILYVGRLYKDKGVEYLIKAVKTVKNEHPDVKLVIAGAGPERGNLELQVDRLNLQGSVLFVGSFPHQKIHELYNVCDVFVLPSLIEPFGMVLIEAMACGKPIIGSRVGGIVDIVEDGTNGFLAQPKDSHQLAIKIEMLLADKKLRRELGSNGRKRVENTFSYKAIAEKAVKIYEKALEIKSCS